MLPDFDWAERIGEFWSYPESRAFAGLLIDSEEDQGAPGGAGRDAAGSGPLDNVAHGEPVARLRSGKSGEATPYIHYVDCVIAGIPEACVGSKGPLQKEASPCCATSSARPSDPHSSSW